MQLRNILAKRKSHIVQQWFERVTSTYPADTAAFLKRQNDPFSNPVGNTTIKGLEALYDQIFNGMDRETIITFLDPIIRIRAVQDFSPSQAVGFIFDLKNIIAEALRREAEFSETTSEIMQINQNIDHLCLAGFDIYVHCREQLHNLRVNETRNTMFKALERAGLVTVSGD